MAQAVKNDPVQLGSVLVQAHLFHHVTEGLRRLREGLALTGHKNPTLARPHAAQKVHKCIRKRDLPACAVLRIPEQGLAHAKINVFPFQVRGFAESAT